MKNSGFSLVEVLIAVALVGLAIVSLVAANSVFTQNNATALKLSTSEFLMEQVKELTMLLPVVDPQTKTYFGSKGGETLLIYDDIGDFDDATFSPPINADRQTLSTLAAFTQKVTVQKVSPSNFELVIADDEVPLHPFVRITVDIYCHGQKQASSSWIRANY
jgi:prepilin-type N-terminal cleavage/methylation domain-containing protein